VADISTQIEVVFSDGRCGHIAMISVKNASAGDTIDVGSIFRVVKRAGMVGSTVSTIAAITGIAGTVLTIPNGPSSDGVWIIAYGVAA
jgi:hypothetical protein